MPIGWIVELMVFGLIYWKEMFPKFLFQYILYNVTYQDNLRFNEIPNAHKPCELMVE